MVLVTEHKENILEDSILKPTVSGSKLYIYISQKEIEQMIKEKLFIKNEPTDGVFIRCSSAEVSIPLDEHDK